MHKKDSLMYAIDILRNKVTMTPKMLELHGSKFGFLMNIVIMQYPTALVLMATGGLIGLIAQMWFVGTNEATPFGIVAGLVFFMGVMLILLIPGNKNNIELRQKIIMQNI